MVAFVILLIAASIMGAWSIQTCQQAGKIGQPRGRFLMKKDPFVISVLCGLLAQSGTKQMASGVKIQENQQEIATSHPLACHKVGNTWDVK